MSSVVALTAITVGPRGMDACGSRTVASAPRVRVSYSHGHSPRHPRCLSVPAEKHRALLPRSPPVFEQLRQSLNDLLARATKPEDRRDVLARMKDSLVHAKLGVEDLRAS